MIQLLLFVRIVRAPARVRDPSVGASVRAASASINLTLGTTATLIAVTSAAARVPVRAVATGTGDQSASSANATAKIQQVETSVATWTQSKQAAAHAAAIGRCLTIGPRLHRVVTAASERRSRARSSNSALRWLQAAVYLLQK